MIDDEVLVALAELLEGEPPALAEGLRRASAAMGRFWTDDYSQFLSVMDGAEGDAGRFGYVRLWGVEDLLPLNAVYCVDEFLTDVFLVGTDGGDEAYGLALRGGDVVAVAVPFIPMEDDAVRTLAPSFGDFLRLIVGHIE